MSGQKLVWDFRRGIAVTPEELAKVPKHRRKRGEMLVIDQEERLKTWRENEGLIWHFIKTRASRWLRVAYFGDMEEFFHDLYPLYMHGVDSWLASDRSLKVSTYVWMMLRGHYKRLESPVRLMHIPASVPEHYKAAVLKSYRDNFRQLHLSADDPKLYTPSKTYTEVSRLDLKEKLLRFLTAKSMAVIDYRFGLTDGVEHTLEECGRHFGLTRERVRQIELKAMLMLRKKAIGFCVEDFVVEVKPPRLKRLPIRSDDSMPPWQEDAVRVWEDISQTEEG